MSQEVKTPTLTFQDYGIFFHGLWPGNPKFTEKDYPSLDGKVVIVTGANSGVGYQTVKSLLGSTKAKVYFFARNAERAAEAIQKIELEVAAEYKKTRLDVHFIQIDLSDLTSIKPAVDKFLELESRLDIVIHNAGVMFPKEGATTKQGFELQLGTNNIGPHLLQHYLDPILIKTSKLNKVNESRIVWVSSTASFLAPTGGIHYADPNFSNTPNPDEKIVYGQSKAVNILQSKHWNIAHPEATNVVNASLCPGYLRTELQRNAKGFEAFLYRILFHDARYGAYTELFAALSPEVNTKNTGAHVISFGTVSRARDDLCDPANAEKAWNFLEEQIKPYV
ncbi:short-chain alcohol dehydrogenase [Scheffersomyces coipomensis]|uniref:short-chain alcohol dehydrogenase n=1 Tax=Scheffersomyces coipomensis TaxID=1788519 RepID=UPI00315D6349